jgi:hypothetical protein
MGRKGLLFPVFSVYDTPPNQVVHDERESNLAEASRYAAKSEAAAEVPR